jgi:hypothetical protein
MSLDLSHVIHHLESVTKSLPNTARIRETRLKECIRTLQETTQEYARERIRNADNTFMFSHAEPLELPAKRYSLPMCPGTYTVSATDGSHIDVDRHLPVACSVINIGACTLAYGSNAGAQLRQQAEIYSGDQLILTNPESQIQSQTFQGSLIGIKRSVEELNSLAKILCDSASNGPHIGLVDGSLVLWTLASEGTPSGRYPAYVRDALLNNGFLLSLEQVRESSLSNPIAIAGYISLPRSREVTNMLRLLLCTHIPTGDCNKHCRNLLPGTRSCDNADNIYDRDIFAALLGIGERSAIFRSKASVVKEYYGRHAIHFFYVNTGNEIARVEFPAWVQTNDDSVDILHSIILDQCRRGLGYPVALQEAHEQAVISVGDREEFQHLLQHLLETQGLPFTTSEKNRSKQLRSV